MKDIEIEYKIRINTGSYKDKTVTIHTKLQHLEFNDIPTILIENGYIECWVNNNEFTILERRITTTYS